MSQKTIAQLTIDNNAVVTSETAPDTITPISAGGFFKDIIDSYWNKLDGITVGTVADPLQIPGCFTGIITNGAPLKYILEQIMIQVCNNTTGDPSMDLTIFRATKTVAQPFSNATQNIKIYFENDVTGGNFDNGNHFFTDRYISPGTLVKAFAVEQVRVTGSQGSGDSYRIRLLKNGVEIATSLTYGTLNTSMFDAYGNQTTDAAGFEFPPLVLTGVSLATGDIVTAELVLVHAGGNARQIETGGIFSNT